MILPSIGFLLNLCQAGIPTALFTLTTHSKFNHRQLIKCCFNLLSIQLIICSIVLLLFKSYFHPILPYIHYVISFIVIATFSSVLRSYHLGINQPLKTSSAQIIEEFIRIFVIVILFLKKHTITVNGLFFSMVLGELAGCLYLLTDFKPKNNSTAYTKLYKSILSISLPTSTSQLIHSFTHFLEPLFYKNLLLKQQFSIDQIYQSYGMIQGQVFSLLMIPTFLNNVIYKLLLPKIDLVNHHKTQKLMTQSIFICLCIGLPFSIIFYVFPDLCLSFLYKNTQGASYLKYIAFPFMIYYIQTPLQAYLQAHLKNKILFIFSLIESIISLLFLIVFIPIFKETSLIISYLGSLNIYTICCFCYVFCDLFLHKK